MYCLILNELIKNCGHSKCLTAERNIMTDQQRQDYLAMTIALRQYDNLFSAEARARDITDSSLINVGTLENYARK